MTGEKWTSDLPEALLADTKILAGEPSWPPQAVTRVLGWLQGANLAVVGVELWRAQGDAPVWLASSDYECAETDWQAYVACCERGARDFVRRFHHEAGALFNLVWESSSEHAESAPRGRIARH